MNIFYIVIAGYLALVALAAIWTAVLLLRRRRRRQHPSATPASQSQAPADDPPASAGIYVRLEVLQGTFLGQSQEFTLASELVIGREHTCDIVFDDPSISRRHARVFPAGVAVCLDELGSQDGTQLTGDREEMPSGRPSGDAISLGDTALRLKF